MTMPTPTVRIAFDPTNPGQFFASCGLLELADRIWPGTEGWFEADAFCLAGCGDLRELMSKIAHIPMSPLDPEDKTATPIKLTIPERPLRLDWWQDEAAGGKELKVWAGTMESFRIARAMQYALRGDCFLNSNVLDIGVVVYDSDEPLKKVEPFYFDARRAPNSHSRDIGFSPNDLQLKTIAYPAVELLCLVGLQRFRPRAIKRRIYEYSTWSIPLPIAVAPAGVLDLHPRFTMGRYRFENWYRTGQRKHKAFRSALPV